MQDIEFSPLGRIIFLFILPSFVLAGGYYPISPKKNPCEITRYLATTTSTSTVTPPAITYTEYPPGQEPYQLSLTPIYVPATSKGSMTSSTTITDPTPTGCYQLNSVSLNITTTERTRTTIPPQIIVVPGSSLPPPPKPATVGSGSTEPRPGGGSVSSPGAAVPGAGNPAGPSANAPFSQVPGSPNPPVGAASQVANPVNGPPVLAGVSPPNPTPSPVSPVPPQGGSLSPALAASPGSPAPGSASPNAAGAGGATTVRTGSTGTTVGPGLFSGAASRDMVGPSKLIGLTGMLLMWL